jgi:hypothetical protein
MRTYFWSIYTNKDRIISISELEETIGNYGYIIDFKQFSDISISIQIEIEFNKLSFLHKQLRVNYSIDNFEPEIEDSKIEVTLFLHVNFLKGTGNLRIEVPAVPG